MKKNVIKVSSRLVTCFRTTRELCKVNNYDIYIFTVFGVYVCAQRKDS